MRCPFHTFFPVVHTCFSLLLCLCSRVYVPGESSTGPCTAVLHSEFVALPLCLPSSSSGTNFQEMVLVSAAIPDRSHCVFLVSLCLVVVFVPVSQICTLRPSLAKSTELVAAPVSALPLSHLVLPPATALTGGGRAIGPLEL